MSRVACRIGCFIAAVGVCVIPTEPSYSGGPAIGTELIASGFDQPVFVGGPPGDPRRLLVLERRTGRIYLIKDGVRVSRPFLSIPGKTGEYDGEMGLLGLAFHPNYQRNRFFYVNYTNTIGDTVIERYKARRSFNRARKGSAKLILTYDQPYTNHNAGVLAFSPIDGYLYVPTGDGGSGNDPANRAQSLDTLLGKILRIDVNSGNPYAIPPDNPFVGNPDALPEIWAYGVRNPWRASFDRQTGDLYFGDVGQDHREEIDFQPVSSSGGENYGWKIAEGFACRGGTGTCGDDPGLTPPIHDYDHGDGVAVVGGFVYRGSAIPSLQGTYFFADHTLGRVWSFRHNGSVISEFQERTAELEPPGDSVINNVPSFGEDANGELYIVDYSGEIYKIVPR